MILILSDHQTEMISTVWQTQSVQSPGCQPGLRFQFYVIFYFVVVLALFTDYYQHGCNPRINPKKTRLMTQLDDDYYLSLINTYADAYRALIIRKTG